MKAFCEYNDYEIAGEYEDAGKSGKSIEGRIQFNRMLEDIKSGKDGVSYEYRSNEPIESVEELPNETDASENSLDVEILDGRENFGVLLNYNASMYKEESMRRFAGLLCEMGEKLIADM